MEARVILQPGDLDKIRFALAETADISTSGIIRASGLPKVRGRAALEELLRRGEITNCEGHHHGNADLCHCDRPGTPLIHWYWDRRHGW